MLGLFSMPIDTITLILKPIDLQHSVNLLQRTYPVSVLVLFTFVALYIIFIENNFWKKVALLVLPIYPTFYLVIINPSNKKGFRHSPTFTICF
jgi:hypothetical protein